MTAGGGRADDPAWLQLQRQRRAMVLDQLAARGITDERVLAAMVEVPRHLFVGRPEVEFAYEDRPLPIGHGQTISQPYMVARVTQLVAPRPDHKILEVGAGSGYQSAVLSRLAGRVHAIEIVPELAGRAAATIEALGYDNVTVGCFDGSGGWPDAAPFDGIVVSAGAPRIPPLLAEQLVDGGRLVIPVGHAEDQILVRLTRRGDEFEREEDTRCRYVNLVGRWGVGGSPPSA